MKYLIEGLDEPEYQVPKLNFIEILFEVISIILLLISWIYFLVEYGGLPDRVPIQFTLEGQPEKYGEKNLLFAFPGVHTLLYCLLTIMSCYPNKFKYPIMINQDNHQQLFLLARRLILYFKICTSLLFIFLIVGMVLVVQESLVFTTRDMYYCFIFITLYGFGVLIFFKKCKLLDNNKIKKFSN